MGLSVVVGCLDGLGTEDAAFAMSVKNELSAVGRAMQEAGLRPHVEPVATEAWEASGYGYAGLHALREVAGLVASGKPVPSAPLIDGQDTPHEEALFQRILPHIVDPVTIGPIARLFGRRRPRGPEFAHLCAHSDAEGYYVPADFPLPLVPRAMEDETAHVWPLGSVPRLAAELGRLAAVLGVPEDLTSDADEIAARLDAPATGGPLWAAQPIATHSLLILREACARSLKTGAAIRFA